MKMFMFKTIIITALMFICVLSGMQLANNGIHKMKGYNDPDFQAAVSIDNKNATILGQDISSHDLDAKKKKLEEISSFNFFSSIGKKMSDGITKASEKLVEKIAQ